MTERRNVSVRIFQRTALTLVRGVSLCGTGGRCYGLVVFVTERGYEGIRVFVGTALALVGGIALTDTGGRRYGLVVFVTERRYRFGLRRLAKRTGSFFHAESDTGGRLRHRPIGYLMLKRFTVSEEEGAFIRLSAHARETIMRRGETGRLRDQILLRNRLPVINMTLG